MLSRHLFGEPTHSGGVCPGEQLLLGPQLYNEHSHLYRLTIAPRHLLPAEQLLRSPTSR
jgi:hypothetical protein